MRVIVSGPAAIFDENGREILELERLQSFNDLRLPGERMSDHFDGVLSDIQDGHSFLRLDHDGRCVRVHTEFRTKGELRSDVLDLLVQRTIAQWADGCGEDKVVLNAGQISLFPLPYDKSQVRVSQIREPVVVRLKELLGEAGRSVRDLAGGGINRQGKWGQTQLMRAAAEGDINQVHDLLRRRADLSCRGDEGQTCLTLAVMNGHSQVVQLLLEAGANPNEADDRMPALHWASNRGYIEIIDSLLEHGANQNATNGKGESALFYVQRWDVLEHLLKVGTDPCIVDLQGHTAADNARIQAEALRSHRNWPQPERVAFEEQKAAMLDKAYSAWK